MLDGSSACVCVSDRECLARHSGAGSARLASASVIRMDGGKMETARRKRKGLLESLSCMVVLRGKSASSDNKYSTMSRSRECNRPENNSELYYGNQAMSTSWKYKNKLHCLLNN